MADLKANIAGDYFLLLVFWGLI